MFGRLESLEKLVSANPYLAFSRAANSPKAQEDPFNVDYLAHPTSLAKEASFAFNMPHMPPISDHSQSAQNENATTWDLLNLGEDLPPMSNTIRQSFFDGPQVILLILRSSFSILERSQLWSKLRIIPPCHQALFTVPEALLLLLKLFTETL